MIKVIISAIVIAGIAVVLYAAARPDNFRIERSVRIKASAERIYPFMSDFHKGDLWVPYEKKDPGMKRKFSGPANGKGAIYEFDGNKQVGKGRLEIVEAVPPTKVVLTLDMIKPMQGHNIVQYTIRPDGDGSDVTWAMQGACSFVGKFMGMFFKVDKMVGRDFETGLANLKALVEQN